MDREGGTNDRVVVIARLGLAGARAGRQKDLEDLTRRVERDPPDAGVQVESRVGLAAHLNARVAGPGSSAAVLALPSWGDDRRRPPGTRLAESRSSSPRRPDGRDRPAPADGEEELIVRRSMALVPTAEFRPLFRRSPTASLRPQRPGADRL
jgi:hypothetical protein